MPSPGLLGALVRKSVGLAQPMAQGYAEGNMLAQVAVTRPGVNTFDRTTGQLVNETDVQVYAGKARIYDVAGGQVFELGEEQQYYASSYVSIPLSAERPQVNDDVEITVHPDPSLTGRHYRVTAVDSGGLMPAVYRMTVIGAAPAPNAP